MLPELLAGKMHALAKEKTIDIEADVRAQLELASDYLLAVQDFRDSVESAIEEEDEAMAIANIQSAMNEFDETTKTFVEA